MERTPQQRTSALEQRRDGVVEATPQTAAAMAGRIPHLFLAGMVLKVARRFGRHGLGAAQWATELALHPDSPPGAGLSCALNTALMALTTSTDENAIASALSLLLRALENTPPAWLALVDSETPSMASRIVTGLQFRYGSSTPRHVAALLALLEGTPAGADVIDVG